MDIEKVNQENRSWSILVLCVGYGEELLRSTVEEQLRDEGFQCSVYDGENYPADPTVHSHEACVLAVKHHDIVIAILGSKSGGTFQWDTCKPSTQEWLLEKGIILRDGETHSEPSILQVEVLTAKALNKPVVVLIDKDVQAKFSQTLKHLREDAIVCRPRPGVVISETAKELIASSRWEALNDNYEVGSGHIDNFSQIVFLEKLRKETPNFIRYFDKRNLKTLNSQVLDGLRSVGLMYLRIFQDSVLAMIERARPPVGIHSLLDLRNANLLIQPPVHCESGSMPNKPIILTDSENVESDLVQALIGEKSTLLLGDPGMGKTTISLMTYLEILRRPGRELEGPEIVYASLKKIAKPIHSLEELVRSLIGDSLAKSPWPIPLHNLRAIIILDGLDESQLSSDNLNSFLVTLQRNAHSILCTSRSAVFFRRIFKLKDHFQNIIQFDRWDDSHLQSYVNRLQKAGRTMASSYVEERIKERGAISFLSVPLWLNMLTYMGERAGQKSNKIVPLEQTTDYKFIETCMKAVCEDELNRQGGSNNRVESLLRSAMHIGWLIHSYRRNGRQLSVNGALNDLELQPNDIVWKALSEMVQIDSDVIEGFQHEVFLEYWLARYLFYKLDKVITKNDGLSLRDFLETLSYQRSPMVNKMFRDAIYAKGCEEEASKVMREGFFKINMSEPKGVFTQNQLVYFIGRLGSGFETKAFLRQVFFSSESSPLVKNSSAFGLIRHLDTAIEKAFFDLLSENPQIEEANRAYHLYYYGDIDCRESEMLPKDDGSSSGISAIETLISRLGFTSERSLLLRRIEVFTLKRIIETRQVTDINIHAMDIKDLEQGINDALEHFSTDKEYCNALNGEWEQLLIMSLQQ